MMERPPTAVGYTIIHNGLMDLDEWVIFFWDHEFFLNLCPPANDSPTHRKCAFG